MHELSLCNALIAEVERVAREQQASRVISVLVRVGPLSGAEVPLLERAFPLAAAGTALETIQLTFEDSPVRVCCLQCGAETEASVNRLLCGACGAYQTRLLSGDELVLAQVELLIDEPPAMPQVTLD